MIPCCFHPTKVVVIDDNIDFMRNLNQMLPKDSSTYQFYQSPQKALYYINEIYKPSPFTDRYIKHIEEESWEHRRLDVNIQQLHHEIYSNQRFEEISTIIIDHSMPGMSGLNFCRQLENPNLQKILLTGVADEYLAIQAFNEGLIHHYIRKQDFDMIDQLEKAIEVAQWRYFNKLSEVPIKAIIADGLISHALDDKQFQILFQKVMKQYRFSEAYLFESMGSFLFLTEDSNAHGLIVNSADQLEVCWEAGEALHVDPSILEDLRTRKKIMFYLGKDGTYEPESDAWKNHLYPASTIQGQKDTFYYAFAPNLIPINKHRIYPFTKYKVDNVFEILD